MSNNSNNVKQKKHNKYGWDAKRLAIAIVAGLMCVLLVVGLVAQCIV